MIVAKYLTEILDEVNQDPARLVNYRNNAALRFLFEHAFIPEKKFDLPEGDPPFKPDSGPLGMSPANFMMETKKLYVFTKDRPLNPLRREQLFIQLLENVHPSEARVLCAVKDQRLTDLYKNITVNLVADNGFIPEGLKVQESEKKRRARPPKQK